MIADHHAAAPAASCFWHSKAVPARSRQLPAIMFPVVLVGLSEHVPELTKDMADRDNLHWAGETRSRIIHVLTRTEFHRRTGHARSTRAALIWSTPYSRRRLAGLLRRNWPQPSPMRAASDTSPAPGAIPISSKPCSPPWISSRANRTAPISCWIFRSRTGSPKHWNAACARFPFFWGDGARYVSRVQAAGAIAIQIIGSIADAKRAADAAQTSCGPGPEAGGHVRGEIRTMTLVPQVVDILGELPVLAGGGIVDRRGVAAAMALGARGVWVGTRFLAATEANIHPQYRQLVLTSNGDNTLYSELFDIGLAERSASPVAEECDHPQLGSRRPSGDAASAGRGRTGCKAARRIGNPALFLRLSDPRYHRRCRSDGALCRRGRRARSCGAARCCDRQRTRRRSEYLARHRRCQKVERSFGVARFCLFAAPANQLISGISGTRTSSARCKSPHDSAATRGLACFALRRRPETSPGNSRVRRSLAISRSDEPPALMA